MASPKSPLTILCEALQQTTPLKGFARSIKLGKNFLPEGGAPPRIVIFPRRGPLASPQYVGTSMDVQLEVVARLWGANIDNAWDLRARFLKGMWEQGIAGGAWWSSVSELWDDSEDTAEQGQALEVVLTLTFTASDKSIVYGRALVENTWAALKATLTTEAGVIDTQIYVDATLGYPSSGIVYVDDEQISYSALTATSFVGCLRGLDGTTPAVHAVGAIVSVTPSP